MKATSKYPREGIFKSVALAYFILVLHLVLLAGLGLLVLFFGAIVRYMFWIFLGGAVLLSLSAYLFYRRLKKEGKTLSEALQSPIFGGRAVEINLLGGLATLRLGEPDSRYAVGDGRHDPLVQLEDPQTARMRELAALARLLEKELITPEEFVQAKQRLLGA